MPYSIGRDYSNKNSKIKAKLQVNKKFHDHELDEKWHPVTPF